MKKLLEILGFIWLLPFTLLMWLLYILPLILFKEVKYVRKASTFVWEFSNPIDPTSWYDKLWARWGGWSGPCVIILHEDMYKSAFRLEMVRKHELRHCKDQFKWGVFFYPAYIVASAWIGFTNLFKKRENKKHIYLFNPFEMAARKDAGQIVDVPREYWPDGPDDYNPWM